MLEHPQRFGARGRAVLALMQANRFGDLLAHREHRVERGHRLLEDHRDFGATNRAHRRRGHLRQVDALACRPRKLQAAVDDAPAAVLDEPHDRKRGDRLARPRFADDGDGLAAADRKGQSANRGDQPVDRREFDGQSIDGKDRWSGRFGHSPMLAAPQDDLPRAAYADRPAGSLPDAGLRAPRLSRAPERVASAAVRALPSRACAWRECARAGARVPTGHAHA